VNWIDLTEVIGSFDHGNEPPSNINCGIFLD
jgi:hypothetical protein